MTSFFIGEFFWTFTKCGRVAVLASSNSAEVSAVSTCRSVGEADLNARLRGMVAFWAAAGSEDEIVVGGKSVVFV